jgi:hypothetical protein
LQYESLAAEEAGADPLLPSDLSANRNVSLRHIKDSFGANFRATIVPGNRGANAMWPGPMAVKSVTNKLPPLKERLMPANRPPPV